MMMEAMKEEEQALANDFQIGAGVRIPKEQSVATKSRVGAPHPIPSSARARLPVPPHCRDRSRRKGAVQI